MTTVKHSAAVILVISTTLLAGCGASTPVRYYLLEVPAGTTTADPAGNGLPMNIELGPVSLSEYLDRSGIVSRTSGKELHVSDGNRWAEPLDENFSRVLTGALVMELPAAQVYRFPRRGPGQADYRVVVDVSRFDGNTRGEAVLLVDWTVSSNNPDKAPRQFRSQYETGYTAGSDYGDYVSALGRLVEMLARDISRTLIPAE